MVIAGSFDQDQVGMGGFQELNQVEAVSKYCKYATRLETLESIPYHIEKVCIINYILALTKSFSIVHCVYTPFIEPTETLYFLPQMDSL